MGKKNKNTNIDNNNNNKKVSSESLQQSSKPRHKTLAFININSINNKELEVTNVLNNKIPGVGRIDILGLADTRHRLCEKTYGKHVLFAQDLEYNPHDHTGTAALVSPSLAPHTSILTDISNPSILWLQISTLGKQLFVAICYCNPTDNDLLTRTLENILVNYELLSKIGHVCIMGDLNGRLGSITGDSTTNTRGGMIAEAIKKGGLQIIKSTQTNKWAFCHPGNRGKSIPDIVIAPKIQKAKISHYMVHQNITMGSDGHKLITFNWQVESITPHTHDWGIRPSAVIHWSDSTKKLYQRQIEQDMKTHNEEESKKAVSIQEETRKLQSKIQEALAPHIRKHSNKQRKYAKRYNLEVVEKLLKERAKLLEETEQKEEKTNTTPKQSIEMIQKQIKIAIKTTIRNTNKKIWSKIAAADECKNRVEYWKMIKRERKTERTMFPSMLKQNNSTITGKQEIADCFAKNYLDICKGKDQEAHAYRKINTDHMDNHDTTSKRQRLKKRYEKICLHINEEDDANSVFQQHITEVEVEKMMKKLKLKSAPGEDNISMEALRYAGPELLKAITHLLQRMWSKGEVPDILQKSTIIPLYKKGEKTQTINYRPVALLNCIFKVYEKGLKAHCEENGSINFCQKGSITGSGTVEAVFALYSAMRQNKNKPITMAFLDLSKAYDRVWRTGMWTKIWEMGIKGRLFRAIHSTYSNATFQYQVGNTKSSLYHPTQGIRQGSVLSPLLFIMLYTDIVNASPRCKGIPLATTTGEENLTNQCFVDDTVLIAGEPADIISQIEGFNSQAAIWGTILNLHKTKIISNRNMDPIKTWMTANAIEYDGSQSQLYPGV